MKLSKDAVELWCKEVAKVKSKGRILTSSEAGILCTCLLREDDIENDVELRKKIEDKSAGILSVFWYRVKEHHTYEISVAAAVFICEAIVKNNFGKSTMMANYLQWVCYTEHLHRINIAEICERVFPIGVPTEEQRHTLWDAQKVDPEQMREMNLMCDNVLDYPACMESIKTL